MKQQPILSISNLHKRYQNSSESALNNINLDINAGEIFALLGPNGAGKTTLINIITGMVRPSAGSVNIGGFDIVKDYRAARTITGLVPQELLVEHFETVWDTVNFSRRLFGKPADDEYIGRVLRDLSLWDKRDKSIRTLSGGMKRRLMIAKALAHEPKVLFLDEPSAGVDVELRRSMWGQVERLRQEGVTIILTTHYLEEAEEMADRIGVITHGELIVVERKDQLMKKLGKKQVVFELSEKLSHIPALLQGHPVELGNNGQTLIYTCDTLAGSNGISHFLHTLKEARIDFADFSTKNSSLEEIFIKLVRQA